MLKFKRITALLFTAALLTVGATTVSANENLGFTVKMIPNEQTIAKNVSWTNFSVDGKTGQEIANQYRLENRTDQPKTIKIQGYNGFSQPVGSSLSYNTEIQDGGITDKNYEFLPLLTEQTKEVVLGPNETKDVSVSLIAPELIGEAVGGLSFTEIANKENNTTDGGDSASIQVEVVKEYVIAVQMFGTPAEGGADFISKDASAQVIGQRTNILWNLENPNPVISTQPVEYKLTKGTEVIQEGSFEKFKMAPKTYTMARFIFEGELAMGDYVLTVNGTEMPFNISEETVERAKDRAPDEANITVNGIPMFVLILAVVVAIILLSILFFILMKKREKKMKEKLKNDLEKEMAAKELENKLTQTPEDK